MSDLLGEIPDMPRLLGELLAQVPAGRVTTYGQLAEALGNRIAARWVGHFGMHHDHRAGCPCHRVVRTGGQLGQYIAGGEDAKARRLAEDGVEVHLGQVDLVRYGFDRFVGPRPLERLRRVQEELLTKVSLRPRRRIPRLIGGVDLAYPRPDVCSAAYVLVAAATGELVWSKTIRHPVVFPYITSYLTFRELPGLLALLEQVRAAGRLAEVVLVDGSGVLHPRHAGVATHLGVAAATPTIGVTKKLLCGQVDIRDMQAGESRPIVLDDQLTGVALRPTSGSQRPIFISPGHRVDVAYAEQAVRRVLTGRRLPEPLYWADRLSRRPLAAEDR